MISWYLLLIAKLLNPIAALGGIGCGYLCRAWWQMAVAVVVIVGMDELMLSATQMLPRSASMIIFSATGDAVAIGLFMWLGVWLRNRKSRKATAA